MRHKAFLPPPLRGTPLVNEWGKRCGANLNSSTNQDLKMQRLYTLSRGEGGKGGGSKPPPYGEGWGVQSGGSKPPPYGEGRGCGGS